MFERVGSVFGRGDFLVDRGIPIQSPRNSKTKKAPTNSNRFLFLYRPLDIFIEVEVELA